MARAGGSSKFVPVNLNKSYGQPSPNTNNNAAGSASLSRSRSYGGSSHGGMVYLTRSSRVSSSSVTVSAASPRVSKLAVPRPVNLPSLRREHAGNDPTVALVGGSGSSGWSKQVGEEVSDSVAVRSEGLTGESTWGSSQGKPPTPSESVSQVSGRPSAYTPPGSRNSSISVPPSPSVANPVEKVVVFRGEDFPTLQAAAVPGGAVSSNQQRLRDNNQKQRFEGNDPQKKPQQTSVSDAVHRLDPRAQSTQVQGKGASAENANENSRAEGWNSRGPSPLIRLNHTSNWADDERETLSTLQPQDRNQSEWSEQCDEDNWGGDYNGDVGYKRPTSRGGYSSRNDIDSLGHGSFPSKVGYAKEGDSKHGYGNAARFDMDFRGDSDRFGSAGRSDLLRRGWSFSAVESNSSRDGRFRNPENNNGWERDSITRGQVRGGNMPRPDSPGWDLSSRDVGQGQDYRSLKGAFPGKQGFNSRLPQADKSLRVNGFLQESSSFRRPSPGSLGRQEQIGIDHMREKRPNAFPAQLHTDDPFLGDIISTRSGSFLGHLGPDTKVSKIKKETTKGDDIRDPAREHFEAELERVQKMLELERHRAIEEQERALELARKEQEEQERIAREEEELRLKLEEEAREAAARAQREAEEAARKAEELRKAREDEKRMMALEEERRKEAARRKLLELEERIAKRANEKKQDEPLQVERTPTVQSTQEASMQIIENGRRGYETNYRDCQGQFVSSFKNVEKDEDVYASSRVGPTDRSSLPSLLESPSSSSHVKEDHGFSMRRHRQPQTWKREPSENGHSFRGTQKGPPHRNPFSQGDVTHSDYEIKSEATRNVALTGSDDRISTNNTNDRGSGIWWTRAEPPVANYPQPTDASEYPSYGRLRQSLPKQPRVLPPPPRQIDGSRSIPPVTTEPSKPSENFGHKKGIEVDGSIHAIKHFEPTPSEEVVLSDAVSQFSDDTIEDVPTPAEPSYQEQDLHSDVVSESYSEEADEISDLTDAQESSEEAEAHVPISEIRASTEDETVESGSTENLVIRKGDQAVNEKKIATSEPIHEVEKVVKVECPVTEDGVSDKDTANSRLLESRHEGKMDEHLSGEARECHSVQSTKLSDNDSTSDRAVQDITVQPVGQQLSFVSANALDAVQMGHLEGMASRQNLVQQFQQPFSFMAVPLPQPNALSNVGANQSMLSSLHSLQNQQELPFHLQLGLLPGMPLLPNAIQIGSIQMPLHIHPQIPQFAHMHGQQTPVFQFGQIGHSVPITQPSSIVQPTLQVHHTLGQAVVSHQHQSPDLMDNASGSLNVEKVETETGVQSATVKKTDILSMPVENSQSHAKLSENAALKAAVAVTASITPHEESKVPKVDVSLNQQNKQTFDNKNSSHAQNSPTSADIEPDQNVASGARSNRGRRRSNGPRYRGILGNGARGRLQQNYTYQTSQSSTEPWYEGEAKRVARGKPYRRNPRRTEYKVRRHVAPMDEDSTAPDGQPSVVTTSYMGESREKQDLKTMKDAPNNANDSNKQNMPAGSRFKQTLSKGDRLVKPIVSAASAGAKGIPKKYEADAAGDAPLRTGVVCVFEQPGIETQNDKDDFIKVRSKRQLLREQREQREKESKAKSVDSVHAKRSNIKSGSDTLSSGNTSKNSMKRKIARDNDNSTTGNKLMLDRAARTTAPVSGSVPQIVEVTAAATTANESISKRSSASQKPLQSSSIHSESGTLSRYSNELHSNEQPTTVAWGGQRSNQEVVSFTQIQLEEAMKPFRAEGSFTQTLHAPERSILTLEPRVSPALGSEKLAASVKAPGPISSLLAGEKIQFGAVTSPPLASAGNTPQSPRAVIQIGSPLGLRSDASHVPNNPIRSVASFLESDATFTSKDKCTNEDDNFQGKVADLEAEAEAAASAVAVAAISNEDPIESHRNTRVSVLDGCETSTIGGSNSGNSHSMSNSGLSISRPGITQPPPHNGLTDNNTSVSLPADLSVDMPPTLFQGSLPASSGVMLQSLPGGAAAYPCLEMGPMLGGPIFTFGPREDSSFTSLEPALAGWQQRHLGAPESFYGTAPPFMSPAGLPGIQGHPHMLVYTNPFTPVGQFGQLGVSFMGTAYHASGKQPDWTHVPIPSSSSAILGLNESDANNGLNGAMPSRHANVSSNPSQQTSVTGSSILPVASSAAVFDGGLSAPFQSHWSKAPAPPGSSTSILAAQNASAVGFNMMQTHQSRTMSNQLGHVPNLMDVSSGFCELPVLKPAASATFPAGDASAQFPDELGLGDSVTAGNVLLNDGNVSLSGAGHGTKTNPMGVSDLKLQHTHHVSHGSHVQLSGVNGSKNIELGFLTGSQDGRDLVDTLKPQKVVSRQGSSARRNVPSSFSEPKSSSQVSGDNIKTEWSGGNHRKGGSGRFTADRTNSGPASKFKQIYVAKSTPASAKTNASADAGYRV